MKGFAKFTSVLFKGDARWTYCPPQCLVGNQQDFVIRRGCPARIVPQVLIYRHICSNHTQAMRRAAATAWSASTGTLRSVASSNKTPQYQSREHKDAERRNHHAAAAGDGGHLLRGPNIAAQTSINLLLPVTCTWPMNPNRPAF